MKSSEMTATDSRSHRASHRFRRQSHATDDANVGSIERWGSVIGGVALAAYGLKRRSLGGAALALLGGGLVYRGIAGYCQLYQALGINTAKDDEVSQVIAVERAITVDKPPEELYRFWHQIENLPRFMTHLTSVQRTDHNRSHWVARAPFGTSAEWDAEITAERDNELIAWRSLEGSRIPNEGYVRFQRAPGGRGTEVRVRLAYRPPLGKLGATMAKLFGEEPNRQLEEDLRRLKCLMEAGEIPTITGQPSGRVSIRHQDQAYRRVQSRKPVRARVAGEASGQPSPASDAPASTFRHEGP